LLFPPSSGEGQGGAFDRGVLFKLNRYRELNLDVGGCPTASYFLLRAQEKVTKEKVTKEKVTKEKGAPMMAKPVFGFWFLLGIGRRGIPAPLPMQPHPCGP